MPIITTIEEFNDLDDSTKEQLTKFLNDKFILYHITFEVVLNNSNLRIKGKSNKLLIKYNNENLMCLEDLESFFDYTRTENKSKGISITNDQVIILNIVQLKVTAYTYFKYVTNPILSYQENPYKDLR